MKFFALAIVILGFSATSFGQTLDNATASATGTIVTPILVAKTVDLNFGNVAVNTTEAGTVVLTPAGTRTRTGGVTLPAVPGDVFAAKFTVTGTSGYAYTFTVPTTATIVSGAGPDMTVTDFTSNATGVITGGSIEVSVGATLNVAAGQTAGEYTSTTPFTVTVNYN